MSEQNVQTPPEQTAEQKVAINQFHIARIAEHFRQAGARVPSSRRTVLQVHDLHLRSRAALICPGRPPGISA